MTKMGRWTASSYTPFTSSTAKGGGGALLDLFRQVLKITCPEISVPAGLKVQCPEIIVPPIDYSAAKPGESIILQLSL